MSTPAVDDGLRVVWILDWSSVIEGFLSIERITGGAARDFVKPLLDLVPEKVHAIPDRGGYHGARLRFSLWSGLDGRKTVHEVPATLVRYACAHVGCSRPERYILDDATLWYHKTTARICLTWRLRSPCREIRPGKALRNILHDALGLTWAHAWPWEFGGLVHVQGDPTKPRILAHVHDADLEIKTLLPPADPPVTIPYKAMELRSLHVHAPSRRPAGYVCFWIYAGACEVCRRNYWMMAPAKKP